MYYDKVIEARRLMRNMMERERARQSMGRERKAGKQGKIHGVKDDWNETQLCEVARKTPEDEEWKRG